MQIVLALNATNLRGKFEERRTAKFKSHPRNIHGKNLKYFHNPVKIPLLCGAIYICENILLVPSIFFFAGYTKLAFLAFNEPAAMEPIPIPTNVQRDDRRSKISQRTGRSMNSSDRFGTLWRNTFFSGIATIHWPLYSGDLLSNFQCIHKPSSFIQQCQFPTERLYTII